MLCPGAHLSGVVLHGLKPSEAPGGCRYRLAVESFNLGNSIGEKHLARRSTL